MSDLAPGFGGGTGEGGATPAPAWRRALGALGLVIPLCAAVAVAAPRLWHTVHTEPTSSTAVQQLPAQQPPAGSQLPREQAPAPARGQVADLGRFTARDPFASPLVPARKAAAPAPASAVPASIAAPVTAPATPASAVPASVAAPVTAPAAAVATISVNGIAEQVAVGGSFPGAAPVFRLVAVGAGAVQIGVLADAAHAPPAPPATAATAPAAAASPATAPPQTVTLEQGRSLTLLDTASGARYELRLASLP